MLYVLAANYEEARGFAYSRGHHYTRMSNVDMLEKLMGLRNVTLFVVRGAENRKNYSDLIQEATIRGLQIEYVTRNREPINGLRRMAAELEGETHSMEPIAIVVSTASAINKH